VRIARKTLSASATQKQLQFILQGILRLYQNLLFLAGPKCDLYACNKQTNAESLKVYCLLSCANGYTKKQSIYYVELSINGKKRISTVPVVL